MMGLIVKNTTYDSGEDILPVGAVVTIMETGEQAEVVMNFGNLYQVKKADGTIATYSRLEISTQLKISCLNGLLSAKKLCLWMD